MSEEYIDRKGDRDMKTLVLGGAWNWHKNHPNGFEKIEGV